MARALRGGLVLACLALVWGPAPAQAQWYYAYEDDLPPPAYWEPPRARPLAPRPMRPAVSYPLNETDDLPAPAVVQMLRERGFRNIAPPRRSGLVYVVEAADPAGRRVRLAVECFTGLIVSRQVLGPATASAAPPEPPAEKPQSRAAKPAPDRPVPERQRQAARVEPPARAPAPLPPSRPGPPEPATTAAAPRSPEPKPAAPPEVLPQASPQAPPPAETGWVTPPALGPGEARASAGAPRLGPPRRVRVGDGAASAEKGTP